jgi:hypothetical protein
MPLVSSVVLRISKPNLVFDPYSELDVLTGPAGNLAEEIPRSEIEGSIAFSELKLHEGTTQVQVIGKDKNGDTVGLASEPISIKLPPAHGK